MARISDRTKKLIIADKALGMSTRELARKYGVSATSVRNILKDRGDEVAQKCAQKKEENTLEMLAYMDSKKGKAQEVIDLCLTALSDPARLERATLAQIGTVLGIVIDKFTKGAEIPAADDDGFVDALNSKAGEVWPDGDTGDIPV